MTDEPDLSRVARSVVDENGVLLYHENLEPGLNGYWVEAKDLRVGDVFLGVNGEISTLTNIVRIEQAGGIAVFNFTVEGNHNYFILEKENDYGQSCVLVHNALFYHGTDSNSANSIVNQGLRKDKMRQAAGGIEDGKGLSLTPDLETAQTWAQWRALERGGDPSIVAIDQDAVKGLLGTKGWTDAGEVFIDACNFSQVKPGMFRIIGL